MYHCGTNPALHHIANGMFGMVIVEPKGGLPVDHEFAFVQSEWYLGQQGRSRTSRRRRQRLPRPTSSCSMASRTSTRTADPGPDERAGPGVRPRRRAVDRHLVPRRRHDLRPGHKEGVQLLPATPAAGAAQAVDLAPAQGAVVEFEFEEDGLYPFVTHAFNFVTSRRDRALHSRRRRPAELGRHALAGGRLPGRSPASACPARTIDQVVGVVRDPVPASPRSPPRTGCGCTG